MFTRFGNEKNITRARARERDCQDYRAKYLAKQQKSCALAMDTLGIFASDLLT
jgi:hypothetical protein